MSDAYEDHYHVLGLHPNATDRLIKNAFHKLSLQWHPDKNGSGSDQFLRINKAYRILMDSKKRASYDYVSLKTKSHGVVNPAEGFIVSDELTRRDPHHFTIDKYHYGPNDPKRFFPIPNPGEPNPDEFYEKLKVAVFIGGVLVGAYVSYRLFQRSAPPMPVPVAVIPQAVSRELSEVHPASLWTLISWLAALRSKALSRLAKLTPPGQNIRLSSKTLNASLSSAAEVVANTVTQGPRAAVLSTTPSHSLTSAANVVAKSITPKPNIELNHAAEVVVNTLTKGPKAAVLSTTPSYSLTSAANVVAKSITPKPNIELNYAAEVVAKTLNQGSQAGISSASKTVVAKTLNQGSQKGSYSAADDVTKKTVTGLLKYWKMMTEYLGKGSASTIPFTVRPALTAFKKATVKGVTNSWKWTESKTTSYLGISQRYINRANLDKTTKAAVTGMERVSKTVLYSVAKSTIKVKETATSKARSVWPVNFSSVMSFSRKATEGIKQQTTSYPISSKTQTAAPACETTQTSPSSFSKMVIPGVYIKILIPLFVSTCGIILLLKKKIIPEKPKLIAKPIAPESRYYSAAKNVIEKTSTGVLTGWKWSTGFYTKSVSPALTTSNRVMVDGVKTGWKWTASKTGSYLVSPIRNMSNAVLDKIVTPKK
ncbi:uncharacterized protein LOC128259656 [Drosophila gunungcola]|nr:uncharacterized protein LOC128259656 [Drosophila gunungcola]XP_052848141.1 uncharacterized protein LOC128259656 [Drosophila gunungcola]